MYEKIFVISILRPLPTLLICAASPSIIPGSLRLANGKGYYVLSVSSAARL